VQTFGAFISGELTRVNSKFKIVFGEFMVGLSLLLVMVVGFNVRAAFTALMVCRFFHGFTYSMFFTLYTHCVVYSQWKTGVFAPAFVSSISGLGSRLGIVFNGWFMPSAMILIAFNNKTPPAETPMEVRAGILMIFALAPALFRILGGANLWLFYRIREGKLQEYKQDIAAKRIAGGDAR
jgi:Na+/melibiose symporter-like transporter